MLTVAIIPATIALVLACYALMRLAMGRAGAETPELAGSIIFRVSALHGLILALVFAQDMVEYQALKSEMVRETTAIADLYFDSARYGDAAAAPVQAALEGYTRLVIEEEWQALRQGGRLLGAAWGAWEDAYAAVLDLVPANPRETALRESMLERVHLIAAMRDAREAHGSSGPGALFWFAAVAGVALIATGYYSYRPTRHNLLLLVIFGGFTGLVLAIIHAFSDPFGPPGALAPTAYERLLADMAPAG